MSVPLIRPQDHGGLPLALRLNQDRQLLQAGSRVQLILSPAEGSSSREVGEKVTVTAESLWVPEERVGTRP